MKEQPIHCPQCGAARGVAIPAQCPHMTKEQIFDRLPLAERTLQRRMRRNVLPVPFTESDYPCEYLFQVGETHCMVKYYRGRKLAAYTLTFDEKEPHP